MIGVSERPLTPTESLCIEYLMAIKRLTLVLEMHMAEMQSLPDSSLSATLKKR